MCQLIIGTTNEAKVKQIRGALLPLGIEIKGVEDKSLLPDVKEDGATAQENAKKKPSLMPKCWTTRFFQWTTRYFLMDFPMKNSRKLTCVAYRDEPTGRQMRR